VRHPALLGLSLAAILLACADDSSITDPDPLVPPVALLKDIEIPNLPSPYYHFEYDAAYRISVISFASDARVYAVTWDGDRIVRMVNTVGTRDTLSYTYDGSGHVGRVSLVNPTGDQFAMVDFTYTGAQLTGLERKVKLDGSFVTDKTMTFAYQTDGNLKDIVETRPAITGHQEASTTTDHFEQYDDNINVDGFSLIHDEFSDHLILLPGVQLQRGNPARETFTGDAPNYTVDYTWTYDDKHRPLTKVGDLSFTSGPQEGQEFQTKSTFSYY
jgi:hypothetical protein